MTIGWQTLKLTKESLIDFLQTQQDWVTSSYLSELFNTTSRTIRNYVVRINKENSQELIESSYRGYRFNKMIDNSSHSTKDKLISNRPLFIIRKLINSKNKFNFYDLAAELYISESTLYNDLKQANNFLEDFSLQIIRAANHVHIKGSERNKRKLIYHLLSIENKNNFIAFAESGLISEIQVREHKYNLKDKVLQIFNQNNFHINDFGLNNLIIHILVIVDRIKKGKQISETISLDKFKDSPFYHVSNHLKELIESTFKIIISDAEHYYLILIIASNSNPYDYTLITAENIKYYIDEHYITVANTAVKRLEEIYYLEPFDNSFMVSFTIHIANMIQRAHENLFMKNPLTMKTKTRYPLIYDMAVVLTSEICAMEEISINEDEITFIAFYIGTYIEKRRNKNQKITCSYLYAKYHDMHVPALSYLKECFKDDLEFIKVIPANEILQSHIDSDIIISTIDLDIDTKAKFIQIDIFPSKQNIDLIQHEIIVIKKQKKKVSVNQNIKRFIGGELFKKEFYTKDEFEMIHVLAKECYEKGLCKDSFKDEVIERENLSSTSFNNFVAVPHSLKHSALKSFMSVVINKNSMQWGDNSVNIIILIGISEEDRSAFREIFNDLIIILCDPIYVNQIIKSNDYNDFIETLTDLLAEQAFQET